MLILKDCSRGRGAWKAIVIGSLKIVIKVIYTVEGEIKVSIERMRARENRGDFDVKSKVDENKINIWNNESDKSESQSANYFYLPYLC